ncbi:hypothetical protein J9303_09880 [Bacillaceae bacterium Marseille-Q3522]|nr:hypothetical protein [Bacillaceae bacterium Marseille-Q3522]
MNPQVTVEDWKAKIEDFTDSIDLSDAMDRFSGEINRYFQLDDSQDLPPKEEPSAPDQVEKPVLEAPAEQIFSVYNIELGDTKEEVESRIGPAKRSTYNEYGIHWDVYHDNYQNFVMVGYNEQNKVSALYTNQSLISSAKGIKQGSTKDFVLNELGEPLTQIQKGFTYYQFEKDRDYEVFHLDNSYVTIFFDKHQNNTVTAIQIIGDELEQNRNDFYTPGSEELKEGFEYFLK